MLKLTVNIKIFRLKKNSDVFEFEKSTKSQYFRLFRKKKTSSFFFLIVL